jgi:hypothetical protein
MTENVAREFAEKGATRAKDAYGKAQATAGQATKVMEQTYSVASKGAASRTAAPPSTAVDGESTERQG